MIFNSVEYFIFFIFILIFISLIKQKRYQLLFLLLASYYFYFTFSNYFLILLVYSSLITFISGEELSKISNQKRKKWVLFISIIGTLVILGFFKYFNFGVEIVTNFSAFIHVPITFQTWDILLPIGISFYTFTGISYIVDIYRGQIEPEKSFCKYALFMSYFPHLLAGPIVRAGQFLPQLKNKIKITPNNLKFGITLITWGLMKKIVIADNVAPIVNSTFDNPIGSSSFAIITATLLFGIQIYCDFSGYCDIALGSSRIIGLHLPTNFDRPYLSPNPTAFWRRWNITLSFFVRDYVYIPLGGNRKGKIRSYVNQLLSMLLCGLWHGAAWNFILWGGYHGFLLIMHKIIRTIHYPKNFFDTIQKQFNNPLYKYCGFFCKIIITQYFIFLGWILFRVGNVENLTYCIKKFIFVDFNFSFAQRLGIIGMIGFLIVIGLSFQNRRFFNFFKNVYSSDWISSFAALKFSYWILYLLIIMFMILCFTPFSSPEFIYFRF